MKKINNQYIAEVDQTNSKAWYDLIKLFDDANLYQMWSYDACRYGDKGISHLVLKRRQIEVAAAQVRIMRLPGLNKGIAYIRWGPLWRLSGQSEDHEVFQQAVRALRNEFSVRRNLLLRIYPMAFRGDHDVLEEILIEEGFALHEEDRFDRTLILDLTPSISEIRASFDDKWRNHLNRAEKNGLEMIMGGEDYLFERIKPIYNEMVRRKGFEATVDIEHLRKIQKDLPNKYKLKVFLCLMNGELCGGAIYSAIGTTGMSLVRATTELGMKTRAAYLIQWEFIKWLKEAGFQIYDLNGINPETNPGTYKFKKGLAGKKGKDVHFLGRYQVSDDPWSSWIVHCGEIAFSLYRRLRMSKRGIRMP